jgi:hypothetical protein
MSCLHYVQEHNVLSLYKILLQYIYLDKLGIIFTHSFISTDKKLIRGLDYSNNLLVFENELAIVMSRTLL